MDPTTSSDLVVENGEIVTMDEERSTFHGSVAVDRGTTVEVGSGEANDVRATDRIDADGGIARPGYIEAHRHSMEILARGSDTGPIAFPH